MSEFQKGTPVWWWERRPGDSRSRSRRGTVESVGDLRVKVRSEGTVVLVDPSKLRVDDRAQGASS